MEIKQKQSLHPGVLRTGEGSLGADSELYEALPCVNVESKVWGG